MLLKNKSTYYSLHTCLLVFRNKVRALISYLGQNYSRVYTLITKHYFVMPLMPILFCTHSLNATLSEKQSNYIDWMTDNSLDVILCSGIKENSSFPRKCLKPRGRVNTQMLPRGSRLSNKSVNIRLTKLIVLIIDVREKLFRKTYFLKNR